METKVKLRVPRVVHKDLSADGVLGYAAQEDFEIEIEPNQPNKEYLDTLIHEMLHCFLPDLSERAIERMANIMANEIWKRRYRKIAK